MDDFPGGSARKLRITRAALSTRGAREQIQLLQSGALPSSRQDLAALEPPDIRIDGINVPI